MSARDFLFGAITAALVSGLVGVWLRESPRSGGRPMLPAAAPESAVEESLRAALENRRSPSRVQARLALEAASHSVPHDGATLLEVEHAAELALVEERTDSQRIEVLRALWQSGSPRAPEIFATAVQSLPDASRPDSVSVPRFALSYLVQSAGQGASSRRALERVAWERERGTSSELRRIAAAGLAAVADQAEARRILLELRMERDALVLEQAAEALVGNPRAGSAAEDAAAFAVVRPETVQTLE